MAVYYATKAYVLSLSEALSAELGGTGITVTALCPGPVHTGFQAAARMESIALLKSPVVMASMPVAEQGYAAMMRGRRLVVPGLLNRLLAFSIRLTPRWLVVAAIGRIQRPS